MRPNRRDNCFDFLRFMFAFNVVLGHFIVITQFPQVEMFAPVFNTYVSVTGFFVISGFLIIQSYLGSTSLGSYFEKRARRLLPAYMLVVAVCAVFMVFLSTLPAADYFGSKELYKYLGANLSFLNFLHPCLPGVFESEVFDCSVNPALWTIKIEVAFYICIPLIAYIIKKSNKPWVVLLVIYVLAVAYRNGFLWLAKQSGEGKYDVVAHQLPGFLSYFASGMALYYYKDLFLQKKNLLVPIALAVYVAERLLHIEYLTPAAYAVMIIWFAYSVKWLNNFGKYGDISYGIYIYHAPLLKTLCAVGLLSAGNVWMGLPVYLLCVMAVAALSWHLLEKRVIRAGRRHA